MATTHISFGTEPTNDIIAKNTLTTIEQFDQEINEPEVKSCCHDQCCFCFNQWWNVKYSHQRRIVHIVEKTAFHVGIIILVLIDCVLVIAELMLDFILLSQKCDNKAEHGGSGGEKEYPKLELAIEILHYGSIFLLAIFVVEVCIKIYAFGKKWWNFRNKKMEWLDATIVIVSFVIDIYFLHQSNVIAEISLLFITFRLWRIVRIINSVAQSIRTQDETSKKHLATTYLQIVELLLNVSNKKTEAASELRQDLTKQNFDNIIEKFNSMDQLCRSILTHCPKPTSKNAVTDIAQNLQDALEQIRLTSTKLGIKNQTKH
ncbi:unnamed protein product [Adineta steineri]|uniref:Voltage-gated hydrogen channel 1 n=1 Tax=Adineta steineri TaxID=433720 RepID=A0A818V4L2_9BILA|nr:unnamed protein product [Adineta steineri]CAF3707096.1 unnamed protein product [Adineta steineri]